MGTIKKLLKSFNGFKIGDVVNNGPIVQTHTFTVLYHNFEVWKKFGMLMGRSFAVAHV